MRRWRALALCTLAAAACVRSQPPGAPHEAAAIDAALATISGTAVRAHMQALAADRMQGREAGTAAFLAAAEYVAARFAAVGLEPLGDRGSYLQNVAFLEARLTPDSASLTLHRDGIDEVLRFGEEFVLSGGFGALEESTTAPLIFAGFGIRAPEYAHDDFAGVDVHGKILVVLTGAPSHFATDQRAFYSSESGKQALAAELGAVGILTVRTPVDQERLPWSRYLAAIGSGEMRWVETDGTPHESYPELAGSAVLSEAGAERLLAFAGRDLSVLFGRHGSGATGSFGLGVSATLERRSEQRRVTSSNILCVVRGSDPALRNEYVLYTAHLDHLGIRPGKGGDVVYNGAYDNAAGVAAVLEIAAAIGRMQPAPRRSILFAAVTAEEKGLRGSDYLAHHPPIPVQRIVANINIDMPFLGFPVADIEGLGVEHSTLHNSLRKATARLGLALTPDLRPELVRFIRSDQFSFVKQGVPGFNLKAGSRSSDRSLDGAAMQAAYLSDHYHQSSDDLTLPYSSEGAERFVRTALLVGLIVANDESRPRWNPGDFFGDRFASPDTGNMDGAY